MIPVLPYLPKDEVDNLSLFCLVVICLSGYLYVLSLYGGYYFSYFKLFLPITIDVFSNLLYHLSLMHFYFTFCYPCFISL